MSGEQYWAARLARFGHTGWSDAAVYAYDQQLRLAALPQLLDKLPPLQERAALDFGCGVGDFCALLAPRCSHVVGHDLSVAVLTRAAQRHAVPRVFYESSLDRVLSPPLAPYGLVLSITVLQHVMEDDALATLLRQLAAAMQPGGYFVVLETFQASCAASLDYLKGRSVEQLVTACAIAGLRLRAQRGFYHPSESPTAAYSCYRSRPTIRALSRLVHWHFPGAQSLLDAMARRAAAQDRCFMDHTASPTQWLVFERAA